MKSYDELLNENLALAATVEALRKHLDRASTNNGILSHHLRGRVTDRLCLEIAKDADNWRSALNSTTQHHLCEVKAEAVMSAVTDDLYNKVKSLGGSTCAGEVEDYLTEYADSIRRGGK